MASARGSCRIARAIGAVLPLNWLGDASLGQPPNSSVGNGSESTRPTWGPRRPGQPGLALCTFGLVGNVLVLVLVRSQQRRRRSLLNCFLLNRAATDLQFVLTLPFWAVDMVRDFSWPFGSAMCKVVLAVLNIASSFFLSAISVARYCAVASALRPSRPVLATAATALFAKVASVGGERLCLLHFPDGGPDWLAFYHLQKIAVAFVLRLATLALTLWGVLVKQNIVPWDRTYFLAQAYLFPLSICLAHSNNCLNPMLYCLLRRDFRQGLRELCGRAKRPVDLRPFSDCPAPATALSD
ncbi:relaxin-3 receptor 1-like [Balaenoptera musculus]|uniref:Relaxin-3 receptor 1-like n=1 Tax=Balaenoptera musculus TaxID=9771 RepID=A0A8B8WKW1_BALMU|nr:relaxin-3 receptor 1-like [Balaenoptera musculus]